MTPFSINLLIAGSALREAWRRNLLALCGLAIGVAAVVTMIALTVIVRREALHQFDRTGLDVVAIRKTSVAVTNAARRAPSIDLEMVRNLAGAVPTLEHVAPMMERRGTLGFAGRTLQATLLGVTETFFDLNTLDAAEGRLLTDFDRAEPYVVVGRDQASALRGGGTAPLVGRQITVEGRLLTIVGVLGPAQGIRLHQGDLNLAVLMPAETFGRVLDGAEITVIYGQHRDGVQAADVIAEAIAYLQSRVEGLGVQGTSAAESIAEMHRQLRLFALLLGATGTIALVLGGTGIMNSLTMAVAERRQEIGLRRALGALRSDIQAQFLYEAVGLCAAGGLIGAPLGVVVTKVIAWQAGWTYFLSPVIPAAGIGLALVVGAVAGLIPAIQAARMKPVIAMKPTG